MLKKVPMLGNRLLNDTNIPVSFKGVLFDDYDTSRRKNSRRVLDQIDEWEPTDSKPFLLLQGEPNVGKTMLASALLNEYHQQFRVNAKSEKLKISIRQERLPVYFIQLAELISFQIRLFTLQQDVNMGIRDAEEYLQLDALLQNLQSDVKVLVVDDVGKEHQTRSGFSQDTFDLLVRTRHNCGLTTIYTTNLPIYRWSSQYSKSMQSVIERSSKIVTF
jgi:DNA replication protein DnaC